MSVAVVACPAILGIRGQHEPLGAFDMVGEAVVVRLRIGVELGDFGVAVEVAEVAFGDKAEPVTVAYHIGRGGGGALLADLVGAAVVSAAKTTRCCTFAVAIVVGGVVAVATAAGRSRSATGWATAALAITGECSIRVTVAMRVAAARCGSPRPGSRSGGRRRSAAGTSTRTDRAKAAQATHATAVRTRKNSCPGPGW
jgi:hypothetical protein